MKHLRRIFLRSYLLFANSKVEAEMAREIEAHLALLEDEYLRQGMTPEDARRAARLAYGGVEQAKQLHRDERAFQGLGQILQDTRYTFRQLRKSPGFTVTAILMLARGSGATTAIFSIVEGVLLRPLPFPDPDRLVILGDVLEGSHCASCAHSSVTASDIRNYMRDTQSFSHLGGYRGRLFELSGSGDPAAVNATRMSGEVFAALGVPPLLGRTFTQQEDEEQQQVAVLSYGMWRSRFHGDANVLGSKILLYRKPFAVIVVLLIACANLAGLLLVRAIRRRREIAVRLALGARAATLLRQAIVESMVLSIAGGAIGLALAAAALRVGVSLLPQTLPRVNEIGLDWPVMLFALGLALLTGFLCGLAPAFAAIRTSVNETLKEGGRTGTSGSGHLKLRSALVVEEIAVALTLLTASGLLLRSFEKMRDVKLGFRPDNTLAALYVLPHQRYRTQSAIDKFTKTLRNDLGQLPGVDAVGITSFLPAAGDAWGIAFTIDGYVSPQGAGVKR